MAFDEVVYERRLTEVEARSKSNTKRINDLEADQKALQSLAGSVQVLAEKQSTMDEKVDEIKDDVKSLKAEPAKKWNGFVDRLWQIAIGIVIGYLAVKIGIG